MFVNYSMNKLLLILLFTYSLAVTTDEIYDNSYALIIGINKYEYVQKLDFAADDAVEMKDILVNSFNFPEGNVTILLDEEATKDNIVREFSDIAFKAEPEDRVVVFFAGHGETMELPEGGNMGYLIPVDGDADNLYYSSIPMDELKRLALMSKAKHMLYLVDACYGGIAAVGSRGLSKNTPNYINKVINDKARQVITAGGKGEQVIEKSEWGHSAFTLNLKRGLKDGKADYNSDGYITANELGMFLSDKVTIDSGNQQTPQYGRMTSQEGEFVFVLNSETTNIYNNDNPQQTSNIQPQQRINYNKLAKEMLKQKEGTSATAKIPTTTSEILNHLKMNSYFFNKNFGFSMNPINMMMSTYSGTISLFSKNKLNKESSLLFYFGSSMFQNDEKLQVDFHRRTFAGRKEWINGKKTKIQDKKGVFTSIGLRYEYRKTEPRGGGFIACTEEDYEDYTCSQGNTHYLESGSTALVNKSYYGFSLGIGARLLFKDIFYWTPAFYLGTHINAFDEPFYKIEILKFGARIG